MSAGKLKRGRSLERAIEDYFVSEVVRCGGLAPKLVDQGRKGFPDRTAIWPCYAFARVHFVELKTIGGKLESWQERYHDDLRKRNAFVFVLWTKKQVDEYIRDYAPVINCDTHRQPWSVP